MANEHVDPMYKYVDDKIKPIKRELKQLKAAHDAVAKQNGQAILALQQLASGIKVNSDVDTFTSIIDTQFRSKTSMRTQIITEASVIKSQIQTSNEPIGLAVQFYQKWAKTFRDLGADIISY